MAQHIQWANLAVIGRDVDELADEYAAVILQVRADLGRIDSYLNVERLQDICGTYTGAHQNGGRLQRTGAHQYFTACFEFVHVAFLEHPYADRPLFRKQHAVHERPGQDAQIRSTASRGQISVRSTRAAPVALRGQ